MAEAVPVSGVVEIEGSTAFQERVEAAYRLLHGYCNRYSEVLRSVTVIEELDRDEATTTPKGIILIGNNVTQWPNANNILQTKILATYIAHESIHTYLLSIHDERWNTSEGERLADEYQLYIARCLGVPQKYIVPEGTIGAGENVSSSICKVVALAIGAIVIYNVIQ